MIWPIHPDLHHLIISSHLTCGRVDDRGDSAGATAIQSMQFWTRPDKGLLASSLSRWMAMLQRRRAKVCCRAHAQWKAILKVIGICLMVWLYASHFKGILLREQRAWDDCEHLTSDMTRA